MNAKADSMAYWKRKMLFGFPIDPLTMVETIERIERAIRMRKTTQHVCINVAKLVMAREDPELSRAIASCQIVSVDGQGVVWAGRLLGVSIPERVAGIDLFGRLMDVASEKGYRVYMLGGTEEVLSAAARRLQADHPDLIIAGMRNGYFTGEQELAVVEAIQAADADMLFVGMTSPKKERFLERHLQELGVPFAMGVGGTFDVVAGKVKRAPLWMQRGGLEWFYRFLSEPGRMWWRYLWTNSVFLVLLVKALMFRDANASHVK